jgi:ligand-binding SRPBCC domain-containing protein
MNLSISVVRRTELRAPAADVWARATTFEGIRHELRPVLSMTMPPALRGKTLDDADTLLGEPLGRSWILLLGFLPVDYDDMRIIGFEPGHSFHESSTMLAFARWEHQRSVTATGEQSCEVQDVLTFTPRRPLARVPGSERLLTAIVGRLFTHRHRRLAAFWSR